MAGDSKDIDLRIRARDYSQKTLEEVTKALEDMAKAQKEQLDAASKGESSARALEQSYRKMEDALKAIQKQFAATQAFEKQAEALERARKAADEARARQVEYAKSLEGAAKITKEQANQQGALASAVRQSDKDVLRLENTLARTVGRLKEYGISTDAVAGAQKRLLTAFEQGSTALEKQSAAIDEVEANIRRRADADRTAAEVAKKAAADQLAAEKAISQAAADAAERERKTAILINAVAKARHEQLAAEKAVADAMRISAQQAEASAKGYQTLARSIKSVRGNELADQLRAIADPSGTAVQNLQGLDRTLTQLQNRVSAIRGPFKDFRATMVELETAQRGAAGIAAQIDGYRRQMDAVRAARAEFVKARADVLSLAQQMRAGGAGAADMGRQMNAAQSALARAAGAMSSQVSKARELRDALTTAGVNTAQLGQAQQALVSNVTRATQSMTQLTAAYKRFNEQTKQKFSLFGSEGERTTLSFMQRMRGELLAIATAYVGVQSAVNLATGALKAYRDAAKVNANLSALVGGDAKLIREEWDYLMGVANRIGFSFEQAAPAYAKFAMAAKAFGFSQQETRFAFEQIATASVKAGQSAFEFEGILKALEQMMSKGTIQAEELRGQLGDRLPGAFTLMAKSMGVTTAELTKMMELGQVSAENVINLAREMGEQYKAVDDATIGMQRAEAQFNNAAFEFKRAIADNGFAEAYTKFIQELTTLMQSEDGARLAKSLGQGFTALVDILRWCAQNVDLLEAAFRALVAITAARWIGGLVAGAGQLVTALIGLRTALAGAGGVAAVLGATGAAAATVGTATTAAAGGVGVLRVAMIALGAATPWLTGLALAAWGAYEAYKALTGVKKEAEQTNARGLGTRRVTGQVLNEQGQPLFPTPGSAATPDPGSGGTAEKRALAALDLEAQKRQEKLDKDRKSAMKRSAKDEFNERQQLIKDEYALLRKAAEDKVKTEAELGKRLEVLRKQEQQALATDKIRFDAEQAKSNESAGNKRIQLERDIAAQLLKIKDDLAKNEVALDASAPFEERKRTRIEAIAHAYDKLRKTIGALSVFDKAGAADATKKLDAYVGQLQKIEAQKATLDEIKRLEEQLNEATKTRDAQLAERKAMFDAGLIAQEEFLRNQAEINRQGDAAIQTAAKNLQAFVDAAVAANNTLLSAGDQAAMKARTTGAIAGASNTSNRNDDAANKAAEESIDRLVAKREAAEAIIKQQYELRKISEDEYAKKVNANTDLYKQKILDQSNLLIQQLEIQRAALVAEGGTNEARLAALDAQIAKITLLRDATRDTAAAQDTYGKAMTQFIDQGLDTSLQAAATALTDLATGTKDVGESFSALGTTVAQFFAQFMMQIAMAIIKQQILIALQAMSGGVGSAAGAVARTMHSGGRVGGGNAATRRTVDMSVFMGAQRYHTGGFPGLKSDEVPIIAQVGEEILSKDNPRNALNGGAAPGQQGAQRGLRFVLVDDRTRIPEAMQSAEGDEVIIKSLRRNAATVKSIVR